MINNINKSYFRIIVLIGVILTLAGISGIIITFSEGLYSWNINNEVPWGISIVNFVFWIGVSHAGTLISAILFLLRQEWRIEIHRLAETMTLISLVIAAFFPWIHTGRQWLSFYWLLPYPNQMGIWVNFQSPLVWDYFAVFTYFTVSLIFWYISLIPDFSLLKNTEKNPFIRKIYDYLSIGWYSSERQKYNYGKMYLILAGLITPLVISVHSIVSFDFAATLIPGWHSTIFPVYFVVGAILSGIAMVNILIILTNKILDKAGKITPNHFDKLNKIALATGSMLAFCHLAELFFQLYSGSGFERNILLARFSGDYSYIYILAILLGAGLPQFFWLAGIRKNTSAVFIISFLILAGMWLERFGTIIISLRGAYMKSQEMMYSPGIIEISIFAGSFGVFLLLYCLFLKLIPVFELNNYRGAAK